MVKGARCYAIGACADGFGEQLATGYAFERFVLSCTEAGLGTCWLGATFTRSRFQHYFDSYSKDARQKMSVRVVSPVGHDAPKQRWGERILRHMSKSDSRKSFNELFSGVAAPPEGMAKKIVSGEILLQEIERDGIIAFALEMMRLAPSSTNSQPWRATVTPQERVTHVTLHSVGQGGRFTLIDMGIGLLHFTETLRLGGRSFDSRLKLNRGNAIIDIDIR